MNRWGRHLDGLASRLSGFGGHAIWIREIWGLGTESIRHEHDVTWIDGHPDRGPMVPCGSRMELQDPDFSLANPNSVFRGLAEEDRCLELTGELIPAIGGW